MLLQCLTGRALALKRNDTLDIEQGETVWGYTDRHSVAANDGCPRGISPPIWGTLIVLAGIGLLVRGSMLVNQEDNVPQLRDGILWLFGGLIALLIGVITCCYSEPSSPLYLKLTSMRTAEVQRNLATGWDRLRL